MRKHLVTAGAVLGLFLSLPGCGGQSKLETIAARESDQVSRDAPIVVFLPGTLASTLRDTRSGEMVWGRDDALSLDPRDPEGLKLLALPLDPVPSDVVAAPDSVRPVDVLRRAHERILGIPVSIGIYGDALAAMREAGLTETAPLAIPAKGPALTVFPYDWRRSIVDASQALGEALEARGPDAQKVRLVGHSMGGAVTLWYLMFGTAALDSEGALPPVTWAGAKYVDRAVLVGAPLRGSVIAVRNTVNGNKLAGPVVPVYPPSMLATHPSSFELMPRDDAQPLIGEGGAPLTAPLMTPETWRRFGWGLADPEQFRDIEILARNAGDPKQLTEARQAALIARGLAFQRAADQTVDPPIGLHISVISGTGTDTPRTVLVPDSGGRVAIHDEGDGDGTVLRSSALAGFEDADMHPRKTALTVEADHMRMISNSAAFEHIMRLLLN